MHVFSKRGSVPPPHSSTQVIEVGVCKSFNLRKFFRAQPRITIVAHTSA
jgi:hypothetical protein